MTKACIALGATVAAFVARPAVPASANGDPYLASVRAYLKATYGEYAPNLKDSGVKVIHACRRGHPCGPRDRVAMMTFSEGDGAGQSVIFVTPDPAHPSRDRYITVASSGGVFDVPLLEQYGLTRAKAYELEAPCDKFRCP